MTSQLCPLYTLNVSQIRKEMARSTENMMAFQHSLENKYTSKACKPSVTPYSSNQSQNEDETAFLPEMEISTALNKIFWYLSERQLFFFSLVSELPASNNFINWTKQYWVCGLFFYSLCLTHSSVLHFFLWLGETI